MPPVASATVGTDAVLVAALAVLGAAGGAGAPSVVRRVRRAAPAPRTSHSPQPAHRLVGATGGALLFAVLAWRLAAVDQRAGLPVVLGFAALGVVLSVVDVTEHRLPNVLVLPAYPVLAALVALAAAVDHQPGALARAVLGAAALFAVLLGLALVSPAGMGFGDVKLGGLAGLVLGGWSWSAVPTGAVAAFVLGGLAGVGVVVAGGSRRTALPFGPFLVAGTLLAVLVTAPAAPLV